jgi:hypothetical protein
MEVKQGQHIEIKKVDPGLREHTISAQDKSPTPEKLGKRQMYTGASITFIEQKIPLNIPITIDDEWHLCGEYDGTWYCSLMENPSTPQPESPPEQDPDPGL